MRLRVPLTLIIALLIGSAAFTPSSTYAQDQPALTLTASAGFDGFFRDSAWMPVIIRAANDGAPVSGRLVVRPETSGRGIVNTYSTPISLASGARQTATLYVTARALGTSLRVEFIADDDTVVSTADAFLRPLQPNDRLYLVISEALIGAADLTAVRAGGIAAQASGTPAALPERVGALDSVNAILIDNADTSALTDAQRATLASWVAAGGHLIVTGGANWQASAAGIADLLPVNPRGSEAVEALDELADWLRSELPPNASTVIAVGDLRENARALVTEKTRDIPLIARHAYGSGTVDYLAVSAVDAPLRGWDGLNTLWLALFTSAAPNPGWTLGFQGWEHAAGAVEILPGFDPLPDILPLCGFLGLYIALIGPVNYVVLSRINRREWAWITIPLLIIGFSVLAYVFGANLRGTEAIVNRLTVVRAWHNTEEARADALIGLLSPRRTAYDLALDDTLAGAMLRPIPRPLALTGLITTNTAASVEVREAAAFEAVDFIVDASFVAGFTASGVLPAPAISGTATFSPMIDPASPNLLTVRGAVRNDGDFTLEDVVILVRGVSLRLESPLSPGVVLPFEITIAGAMSPVPIFSASTPVSILTTARFNPAMTKQSALDILGADRFDSSRARQFATRSTPESQRNYRRQLMLEALVDEPFGTASRGDSVYVAGWSSAAPFDVALRGEAWSAQSETLYLIELESRLEMLPSAGETRVNIAPERFTWHVREQSALSDISPINLQLQPGIEFVIRYTPLPDAVLSRVDEVRVIIENASVGGRSFPIDVFNYDLGEWETITMSNDGVTLRNPAAYLGANNAVELRVSADQISGGGFLRIGRLLVAQSGVF